MNLTELLPQFPFPTETALVGVLDYIDVRVAIAWSRVPKSWREPDWPKPEDEATLWQWIWDGVSYDGIALAAGCALDEGSADDRLFGLIVNRMVHPDGTICPVFFGSVQTEPAEKKKKLIVMGGPNGLIEGVN